MSITKEEYLKQVREEAEGYFQRGEFFCSEAVLQVINDALGKLYPDEVVKLASGFPIGLGKAQCLCGAVSGGEMALGMVYGRVHGQAMDPVMFDKAKELHDFIRKEYKSLCCRVITREWAGDNFQSPERKAHCVEITGKVAEWVAEQLIEDGKLTIGGEKHA
ncbi:C-GCAxxG-C-C family protein [Miniphocaeibacter halophilus]|uniref:C_GCAxxG_C_C family protein n=1 Tax=Miniphocaeibacter halophilus TaxID=2931922 RepID=A0AC61N4A5_9FIRM|nr:C-GCAxxG-C-C family protein [Miniphocaeibacter halophilus]QQK07943.1 C_GCAxxG_C_C family protein [Miniphocaeibacter halophilus]